MKKKRSGRARKRKEDEEREEEEMEVVEEIAAIAKEFGVDVETFAGHLDLFEDCGIIQEDSSSASLFSQDFKDEVFERLKDVLDEEIVDVGDEKLENEEVMLLEAIGYATFDRLVEHGIFAEDEDEKEIEEEFDKIMRSLLFLLAVTGELDEMLEKFKKGQGVEKKAKRKK